MGEITPDSGERFFSGSSQESNEASIGFLRQQFHDNMNESNTLYDEVLKGNYLLIY